MYVAFTVIVFICAMVIQTSILRFFTIGGVKPDLVLVIVVYLGLMKGADAGCGSGFVFGLVEDAYSLYLGTNALTKTVVGFVCGVIGKRLYTQSLFTHILGVAISSVVNTLLILSIHGFTPQWETFMVYEMLYNVICCPWIVYIFRFGEQRLTPKSSL